MAAVGWLVCVGLCEVLLGSGFLGGGELGLGNGMLVCNGGGLVVDVVFNRVLKS